MTKMYAVTTIESEDHEELYTARLLLSLKEAKECLVEDGEEGTIYELTPILTNITKKKKSVWRKP